jgi:hypothetical protein
MKPLRVVILQDVGSFTSSLDWDGILDAPASEINQPNHLLLPNWQIQNCILQTVNKVLDMPIHLTRVLYQSKQSGMKSQTLYILRASESAIHEVPHEPQNPKPYPARG